MRGGVEGTLWVGCVGGGGRWWGDQEWARGAQLWGRVEGGGKAEGGFLILQGNDTVLGAYSVSGGGLLG